MQVSSSAQFILVNAASLSISGLSGKRYHFRHGTPLMVTDQVDIDFFANKLDTLRRITPDSRFSSSRSIPRSYRKVKENEATITLDDMQKKAMNNAVAKRREELAEGKSSPKPHKVGRNKKTAFNPLTVRGEFLCESCGKVCTTQLALRSHMRVHKRTSNGSDPKGGPRKKGKAGSKES